MGPFTKFQSTHPDALWSSSQHQIETEAFYQQQHDGSYQATPQVPSGLKRNIVRMFSGEDASGTSAVAIDNKIEQAMDLVKSHLMIAVREEVEVLKEKISELMDKINQLEVENTILKSNMSQETLHQLQIQAQLQIAGSGASNLIAQPPPQQQTQSQQQQQQPQQQQSAAQPSQQQATQQQNPQQQTPQANAANTTNGPLS